MDAGVSTGRILRCTCTLNKSVDGLARTAILDVLLSIVST